MSRIADAFKNAKREGRAAFVPYVTAGDPSLERTVELAVALENSGADVLELGVPFSDPMADGPTNQRAAERALAAGMHLKIINAPAGIRYASMARTSPITHLPEEQLRLLNNQYPAGEPTASSLIKIVR